MGRNGRHEVRAGLRTRRGKWAEKRGGAPRNKEEYTPGSLSSSGPGSHSPRLGVWTSASLSPRLGVWTSASRSPHLGVWTSASLSPRLGVWTSGLLVWVCGLLFFWTRFSRLLVWMRFSVSWALIVVRELRSPALNIFVGLTSKASGVSWRGLRLPSTARKSEPGAKTTSPRSC